MAEAIVQLLARCRLATIERDRLAVLAHTHQAVAKIGLAPLLPEVQPDQRTADVMRNDAAHGAVGNRRPHHVARQRIAAAPQGEAEAARQRPQDADEGHQRHHRVQQAHADAQRAAGEACNVFLDTLVRVVGHRRTPALPRQLQMVEAVVPQPLVQVGARHPGAPAQVQQLRDVELVHRKDDGNHRQPGEAHHLLPEHGHVLVLQRVVEHVVPLVEQHRHVHAAQVERHNYEQHQARTPAFFRVEIRPCQPPGVLQKGTPAAAGATPGVRQGMGICHRSVFPGPAPAQGASAGSLSTRTSPLGMIWRTAVDGRSRERSGRPGSSGPTCPRRSRRDCGWPVSRMA